MSMSAFVILVLVAAVIAANLPFVNERIFVIGPRQHPKNMAWRLGELVVWWMLTLSFGFMLEAQLGQTQTQGWEFYAASGFLFITLAFPGFVWRYLKKN
jgi:uncharacterized protein YybS (DUF2232 family)